MEGGRHSPAAAGKRSKVRPCRFAPKWDACRLPTAAAPRRPRDLPHPPLLLHGRRWGDGHFRGHEEVGDAHHPAHLPLHPVSCPPADGSCIPHGNTSSFLLLLEMRAAKHINPPQITPQCVIWAKGGPGCYLGEVLFLHDYHPNRVSPERCLILDLFRGYLSSSASLEESGRI